MPPSYSMMLPGRMSTPLIFMSSLGECGKEPARALARGLLPGKHGVRVDRRPLPPALPRSHGVDREVQVRRRSDRVAGVVDPGDYLATLDLLALGQPGRIALQVGVIVHPLLIGRALVDRDPATAVAVEQLFDCAVGSCDHRRPLGGHDVDGVMTSASSARRVERVDELLRLHTYDGDSEPR